MKLQEIEIEYGYDGRFLWPPGSPITTVKHKILFREVSPERDQLFEAMLDLIEECYETNFTHVQWDRCKAILIKAERLKDENN